MATKNFEDRRARRSRKLLKESLLEQMRQKSFSEISVRDITDGADMNRCTFYLHYTGTAQLLESLETDLMAELQTLLDAHLGETLVKGTVYPLLEPVLDFAVEHRETCETVLAKSDSFMTAGLQLFRRNGAPLVESWFHPREEALTDYLLSFLTWGFIGLLREWFTQGMALPREELISAAQRLADSAAAAVFPQSIN